MTPFYLMTSVLVICRIPFALFSCDKISKVRDDLDMCSQTEQFDSSSTLFSLGAVEESEISKLPKNYLNKSLSLIHI